MKLLKHCLYCEKETFNPKYCSRSCTAKVNGKSKLSIEERFWSKVNKTNTCWIWTGASDKGYGRLKINGKSIGAHRISYELHKGIIPEGLQIDHLCRNRICVNYDHLEAVTLRENIQRGLSGSNMRNKTHCSQGHPYVGNNLYIQHVSFGNGIRRKCRTCISIQKKEYYYVKSKGIPPSHNTLGSESVE